MNPPPPLLDEASIGADGFCALRIKDVIRETADAVSLVFDVPATHIQRFSYQAGQFLTLRIDIDGQQYRRCYSMSSSPAVGEDLRITVKRDRGGVVSNWLNDHAAPGTPIDVSEPDGRFVMADNDRDLVAFAGGSGITPVLSLIHRAGGDPATDTVVLRQSRHRIGHLQRHPRRPHRGPRRALHAAPPSRRTIGCGFRAIDFGLRQCWCR